MTRTTLTAFTATAAILLAAGSAGDTPGNGNGHENGNHGSSAAAKLCTAQKKADSAAFKATYGDPKHAMRNCMRANRGTDTPPAQGAEVFQNAAEQCRADRDADPAGFATFWGSN